MFSLLLVLVLPCLLFLIQTDVCLIQAKEETISSHAKESQVPCDECYLYLAPSSINGAGIGVYVTKAFKKGEIILSSDYATTIPIIDPYQDPTHRRWTSFFNNYIWAQPSGASNELKYEAEHVIDLQLGLGAFPNSHSFLYNLAFQISSSPYDDEGHDTSKHPGSGAFSYHKGRTFTASRDINAGEELFLDYGDRFLDSRTYLSNVPRKNDFLVAAQLIKGMKPEIDNTFGLIDSINVANVTFDIDEMKDTFIARLLSVACQSLQVPSPIKERIKSLMPKTLLEINRLLSVSDQISRNRINVNNPLAFAIAKTTIQERTIDWIATNGRCLDNIFISKSSLPFAGNGAISKRYVRDGEIIAPLPLLQISDSAFLSTYRKYIGSGNIAHDLNDEVGTQLLMNYCFGHKNSTLLLCPTTNAIYANHCNRGSNCSPNAEFRWSRDSKTQHWLNKTIDEMSLEMDWLVSFDLVALKDIIPGEEILIDYGPEWEKAWNFHVNSWERYHQARNEIAIDDEMKCKDSEQSSFEMDTVESIPFSVNLFTACIYAEDDQEWELPLDDEEIYDLSNLEDQELLSLFSRDGSKYRHGDGFRSYWPCSLISNRKLHQHNNDPVHNATCLVRLFSPPWERRIKNERDMPRFLYNYPCSSVKLFLKPYKSDMHHPYAFRHYIGISDKIFPSQWGNKKIQNGNPNSARNFDIGDRVEVISDKEGKWQLGEIVLKDVQRQRVSYDVQCDDGHLIESINSTQLRRVSKVLLASSPHPFL